MSPLNIGILADSSLQQHSLRRVLLDCGCEVRHNLLLEQLSSGAAPPGLECGDVDAWVVDIAMDTANAQYLDEWLNQVRVPLIFGDGDAPNPGSEAFAAWSRRLSAKVAQLAGTIKLQRGGEPLARHLWVLGASTGGPQAVKEFLRLLPPALGAAFVYVQHSDTDFDAILAQVMSKNSHYPVFVIEHGDIVRENTVAVVRPDTCIEVLENGTFAVREGGWRGPFRPSIDQVVANVARVYRQRSGVIVFSGMGDDGAASSRLVKQQGGQVWVQSPETCACASMPEAVFHQGVVSFTGAPAALAVKLQQHMKRHYLLESP